MNPLIFLVLATQGGIVFSYVSAGRVEDNYYEGAGRGLADIALAKTIHAMEAKLKMFGEFDARLNKMEATIERQRSQLLVQNRRTKRLESLVKILSQEKDSDRASRFKSEEAVGKKIVDPAASREKIQSVKTGLHGVTQNSSMRWVQGLGGNKAMTRRGIAGDIAFSVSLSHDISHMADAQLVVYDKILVNDGNGYQSGTFNCPRDGVYYFICHLAVRNAQTWLRLMVDGTVRADITAESAAHGGMVGAHEVQSSNSVILRLREGSRVWMESFWSQQHAETLDGEFPLNSFSGFLLY